MQRGNKPQNFGGHREKRNKVSLAMKTHKNKDIPFSNPNEFC